MPKIIHYRDRCIGCGICQEQQPELWRMSKKDGKAVLLGAIKKKEIYQLSIHPTQQPPLVQITAACPVKIIKVV